MRKVLLKILLSLMLAGYAFAATEHNHAHTMGSSTVAATVSSGTANGKSIEGDEATLSIYQDGQIVEKMTAVIDKNGKAFFENVPFGPQLLGLVNVIHDGMSFNSKVIQLKTEPSEHFASIEVYDISDDNSVLSVGTHHIIVKTMPNGISITEYVQLKNPTDTAVFSQKTNSKGQKIIVEMSLPKGFKNLSFADYFEESELVSTETGFYDTMAVPPGNHDCQFSYSIDIDSQTMNIEKQFTLDTSNITVFAQTGDAEIIDLGQLSGELTMQDGTQARYYEIKDMKQGEMLAFKIVGLAPPKSEKDLWTMMSVIFAVVGVVALKRILSAKSENKP